MRRSPPLCCMIVAVASQASAQSGDDGWRFRLTPNIWIPTLSGDMAIGRNEPVSSDTTILDVLDLAAFVAGEARKGDFGILLDVNYVDLSSDATTSGGNASAEIGLNAVMLTLAGAWRFAEGPGYRVDAIGGLRYWNIEADIDYQRQPSASNNNDWVDPILGLRAGFDLTDTVSVIALGDIGGFGVGSDLQWELLGRVNYQFDETWTLGVGYRHVDVDFDDDQLVLDASLSGPFVALDVNF